MLRKIFIAAAAAVMLAAPSATQGSAVTVSWPQEPDTLNFMYTTMTFAGYTIQLFTSPAWDFDGDSRPRPVLVREIPSVENGGISEDGTTFTLRLREGLVWSDGDPLDSADFLFTAEMKTAPGNNPIDRTPFDIATVTAPDPLTVVVQFEEPYAAWLGLFRYVLPEHVLRPVYEAEGSLDNAEFNFNPSVSSGPYILQEWSRGSFMRFTANPNFVGGVPNIETLIVTFVPDEQTYKTQFLNGDAQMGTFLPFSDVPDLEMAGFNVDVIDSGYNEGMFFNVGDSANPAMKELAVRQALAFGFNRQAVVSDLLLGATRVAITPWEGTPYQNPALTEVPYDPARAAALLDEAGWVDSDGDGIRDKDGVKLSIRFVTNMRGIRRDIQALAQQQWGDLGIEVILENYPSDTFFSNFAASGPIATGQYDVAQWSSSPATYPDPDTRRFECDQIPSPENVVGSNWLYYCNPELDRLMKLQRVTTDLDARIDLWHQITEILYNDYVWIGVWFDADVWWTGAGLEAGKLNGVSPFWNVVNWTMS